MTETADWLLAEIRDLADRMPSHGPTLLRVGAGVVQELNGGKPVLRPLLEPPLPPGVDIIEDDTYQPGEWRIFDQWDDVISFGVLPVVGATVQVEQADGSCTRMRVLAVDRDEQGRIVGCTAADANLIDNPWGGTPPDWMWPRATPGRLGLGGPAC